MTVEPKDSQIFEASEYNLGQILRSTLYVGGTKVPEVVYTYREDYLREAARLKKKVEYPIFGLTPRQLSENTSGYNIQTLKKLGTCGGYNKDGSIYYKYHLTPVEMTYELHFLTNDSDEMKSYMKRWLFLNRTLTFDLEVKNGGFTTGIRVLTDTSISFGQLQVEERMIYDVTSTLTMRTYVGTVEEIPTIATVEIQVVPTDITSVPTDSVTDQDLWLSQFADYVTGSVGNL
jgi:hypothetical protein